MRVEMYKNILSFDIGRVVDEVRNGSLWHYAIDQWRLPLS